MPKASKKRQVTGISTQDALRDALPKGRKTRNKYKVAAAAEGDGIEERLDSLNQKNRSDNGLATPTTGKYKAYLAASRVFLENLCKEREAAGTLVCARGIITAELKNALSGKPNRYSVQAIEWYITKKCVEEGLSQSTGEGIRAAWVWYYKNL